MPLEFLANATQEAKNYMLASVNENTVSCTKNITVFEHKGKIFCSPGNLHDKVDATYCIEFDLRYNYGNVIIKSQRIFQ